MALKKDIIWNGLTIPGCYIRIENIGGGKRGMKARVSFNNEVQSTITNEDGSTAIQNEKMPIFDDFVDIQIDLGSQDNIFVQAYAQIKQMDRFVGSVDC